MLDSQATSAEVVAAGARQFEVEKEKATKEETVMRVLRMMWKTGEKCQNYTKMVAAEMFTTRREFLQALSIDTMMLGLQQRLLARAWIFDPIEISAPHPLTKDVHVVVGQMLHFHASEDIF